MIEFAAILVVIFIVGVAISFLLGGMTIAVLLAPLLFFIWLLVSGNGVWILAIIAVGASLYGATAKK